MFDLADLKAILLDHRQVAQHIKPLKRSVVATEFPNVLLVGVRGSGKTHLMINRIHALLEAGYDWQSMLYINFEDERLLGFTTEDFQRLLNAYKALHPNHKKPHIFLDEPQSVEGWATFARRLADQKYPVMVNCSDDRALNQAATTTLGGRYLVRTVFPLSFAETLKTSGLKTSNLDFASPTTRSNIRTQFDAYVRFGGFPGLLGQADTLKRYHLNNHYQQMYLVDVAARHNISHLLALRLIMKTLAEHVGEPLSFSKWTRLVFEHGVKLSKNTLINHVGFVKDAFLIFSIHNFYGKLNDRETNPKYFFADNGLIELLNRDPLSAQLENVVAIELIRRFGLDDRVFYFAHNGEIDFYVPEWDLGIQVTRDLNHNETMKREVGAFKKTNDFLSLKRRLILTLDDERTLETSAGSIEVMPIWKWLLTSEKDR